MKTHFDSETADLPTLLRWIVFENDLGRARDKSWRFYVNRAKCSLFLSRLAKEKAKAVQHEAIRHRVLVALLAVDDLMSPTAECDAEPDGGLESCEGSNLFRRAFELAGADLDDALLGLARDVEALGLAGPATGTTPPSVEPAPPLANVPHIKRTVKETLQEIAITKPTRDAILQAVRAEGSPQKAVEYFATLHIPISKRTIERRVKEAKEEGVW